MRREPNVPKKAFGERLCNSLAQINSRFIVPVRCGHSGTRGGSEHSEVAVLTPTAAGWCRIPKETDRPKGYLPTWVTPERSILNRLTDQFPDEMECTKPCVIISWHDVTLGKSRSGLGHWVGCTSATSECTVRSRRQAKCSARAQQLQHSLAPTRLADHMPPSGHSGRARPPAVAIRYRTHAMHGPAHAALRRRQMRPIAWCVVSLT